MAQISAPQHLLVRSYEYIKISIEMPYFTIITVDPEIFVGQNFRLLIFRVVKFSSIDLVWLYLLNKVIISCV